MLKNTFFQKTEPEQNQNKKTPPKNRIVMRFSGGCLLFVLNRCRGFARNVIHYSVYMLNFVYYP